MALTVSRSVRPSPQWQETYARLQKNHRVVIDVEGSWSPDMRNQIVWCGADGILDRIANDQYLLPGTNIGALIGKIGPKGKIFAIGSRHDFIADDDGVLYLAMNENPQYNNQAGLLTAQIIVF